MKFEVELPASFLEAVAQRAAELALEQLEEQRHVCLYVSVDEAAEYLRCTGSESTTYSVLAG